AAVCVCAAVKPASAQLSHGRSAGHHGGAEFAELIHPQPLLCSHLSTLTTPGLPRRPLFGHHGGMAKQGEVKSGLVVAEITRRGKVARRKDLLVSGCTDWAISVAEREGLIRRIGRGYVALADADPLDVRLVRHRGGSPGGFGICRGPQEMQHSPTAGCVYRADRGQRTGHHRDA
ncbi:MAG: hypothetical protein ABI563_17700, partial [Specibacter sp.]